jgi:hypothetical protein
MARVSSWSPLGTYPRVRPSPLAYIFSSHHWDYLSFAEINLLEIISPSLWFVRLHLVSLIIHPQFRLHLLHSCLCSWLCLQGLAFLARSIYVAWIDNQRSNGVVTARVWHSARSPHHQHQNLHHLTYLYISEDQESTSHQVVSDFRLPLRYYRVSFWFVTIFHNEIHRKSQKKLYLQPSAVLYPLRLCKYNF